MVLITLRERKRREAEEATAEASKQGEENAEKTGETAKLDEEMSAPDEPVDPKERGDEAVVSGLDPAKEGDAERGEIFPEASSRTPSLSRDPPTPLASAVHALQQHTRPDASKLVKHEGMKRRRSSNEKAKGVAYDKDEVIKKKQKVVPEKLVVDDVEASASLFSKINNANVILPHPENLRRSKPYAAMAQRMTKFYAAVNEMMAGYEADALKDERRLEKARRDAATFKAELEKASGENAKVLARMEALKEEKKVLKADCEKMVTRYEESRVRKNSKIACLKRQIAAKDSLLESRVKIARKEARCEAAAKLRARLSAIKKKMVKLEKAKGDENDLGQIRSNLVLIEDLRKLDASLDAEEEKLKS
ncbi:uncharacterized protein LOC112090247 [Eutrema salsugineum]|uniref:uncharacterized protein LOC112090247 n=1 Tax=Eutrema salsugineum TaxID=72664 RepID=UPI000CED5844|nr:uncharacterized protein LOC112090247 [Eutrema salsugineum]